jgi:hypothetical protein
MVFAWLTLSELRGWPASRDEVLSEVGRLDARASLVRIARLASEARVASVESRASARCRDALASDSLELTICADGRERVHAHPFLIDPDRAIAHAQSILVLTALVIAHGALDGKTPTDADVAWLILALNDHLPPWDGLPSAQRDNEAVAIYSAIFASLFNQSEDPVRFLVRIGAVFEHCPHETAQLAPQYEAIQEDAFNSQLSAYLENVVAPLLVRLTPQDPVFALDDDAMSQRWVDVFSRASLSFEAMREKLRSANSWTKLATDFLHAPFVCLGGGSYVLLSP